MKKGIRLPSATPCSLVCVCSSTIVPTAQFIAVSLYLMKGNVVDFQFWALCRITYIQDSAVNPCLVVFCIYFAEL